MRAPRSAVSLGPMNFSSMGPSGIPVICETRMNGSTSWASGRPFPLASPDQYFRCGGMYESRLPQVYIDPHARCIITPPSKPRTPARELSCCTTGAVCAAPNRAAVSVVEGTVDPLRRRVSSASFLLLSANLGWRRLSSAAAPHVHRSSSRGSTKGGDMARMPEDPNLPLQLTCMEY
eukprot:200343-Pleurochrysis_carterae.AAC.2